MGDGGPGEITRLLRDFRGGDREAFDRLVPLVYDELKRVARRQLFREWQEHTLDTGALVHELYLKLSERAEVDWESRAHFFAIAARAMRQILVDKARRRGAEKRGGNLHRTTLDGNEHAPPKTPEEILALDEALERLDAVDERLRQVVELRFFGGLNEKEIGEALAISERSVQRDWAKARAWLYRELYDER